VTIGWLALLFCLFAPPEFSLVGIAAIVPAATVAGVAVSRVLGGGRLVLAPGSWIDDAVALAAKAAFVDLGVGNTRGRTGVLVFVALEERRIEIVADVGVLAAVDRAPWNERVLALRAAIEHGGMGDAGVDALARAIESLAPLMRRALPRAADDANELEDLA
jgi:putative membrane protein